MGTSVISGLWVFHFKKSSSCTLAQSANWDLMIDLAGYKFRMFEGMTILPRGCKCFQSWAPVARIQISSRSWLHNVDKAPEIGEMCGLREEKGGRDEGGRRVLMRNMSSWIHQHTIRGWTARDPHALHWFVHQATHRWSNQVAKEFAETLEEVDVAHQAKTNNQTQQKETN